MGNILDEIKILDEKIKIDDMKKLNKK